MLYLLVSQVLADLVDEVSKIMENPELRAAATAGRDTATSTMLAADTVVAQTGAGSVVFKGEDPGTMVVNSGDGEEDSGTMVFNSPGGADAGTVVVNSADADEGTMVFNGQGTGGLVPAKDATLKPGEAGYQPAFMQYFAKDGAAPAAGAVSPRSASAQRAPLSAMSIEDLRKRLDELEPEKEREIEALRKRYQAKRRPIEEALKAKRAASS